MRIIEQFNIEKKLLSMDSPKPNTPSNPQDATKNPKPIIIDVGTAATKFGFAGDDNIYTIDSIIANIDESIQEKFKEKLHLKAELEEQETWKGRGESDNNPPRTSSERSLKRNTFEEVHLIGEDLREAKKAISRDKFYPRFFIKRGKIDDMKGFLNFITTIVENPKYLNTR